MKIIVTLIQSNLKWWIHVHASILNVQNIYRIYAIKINGFHLCAVMDTSNDAMPYFKFNLRWNISLDLQACIPQTRLTV